MGKKSDPPPPPDYTGAAMAQATASKENLEQQNWANRPNQYTPWGSSTWSNQAQWDPSTKQMINRWQQRVNLSPSEQASFDAQQATKVGKSLQGLNMLQRMQQDFGSGMDWSGFSPGGRRVQAGQLGYDPGGPSWYNRMNAENAIYNKMSSRLDPRMQRGEEQLRQQLANQGLRSGDEAYTNAMKDFNDQRNDAYDQAYMSSIMGGGQEAQRDFGMDLQRYQFGNNALQQQLGMDMQAGGYNTQLRQQQISEALQQRGTTLNEMNAILSGQQVAMPGMPGFNTAGMAQTPDLLGAAGMQHQANMDNFNASQAQSQALMGGLGDAAGMAMMFSDRRLKRNIVRIGTTPGGTALYEYEYIWGGPRRIGVMADEVPHAVTEYNGLMQVDYRKVN